ncbi:zinc-ribbon domain-containing protein [Kribbella ginsengisoli]
MFKTRTRPSWCDEHITAVLRLGGIEPLEAFVKLTSWRLTRCLVCDCEAHYRLEYVLDRNKLGEPVCRACFWRGWAQTTRALQGLPVSAASEEEARSHAEASGFDYLGSLTQPSLHDDPHRVRCRLCQRISATRLSDLSFGCSCQSNPRRDRQTANVSGPRRKELLKDSGLPVLRWWDQERNDSASWETVGVSGRREVGWKCPVCDLRFNRRVDEMASLPSCPACEQERRAAWQAEYRLRRHLHQRRRDETGMSNIVVSIGAWTANAKVARGAAAVIVTGRIQRTGQVVNLNAEKLQPLPLAAKTKSRDFR